MILPETKVLVAYDKRGRVLDFGALEVQAVYISGNVRRPFEFYMENPRERSQMDWTRKSNYPRPDYLSSSRKRLAPQLIFKGGILKAWNRKAAVALNKSFYETLPTLEEVSAEEADIAWLIYDLRLDTAINQYRLTRNKVVYTRFETALNQITKPEIGAEQDFLEHLQNKLDDKLDSDLAPDAPTLDAFS